MSIETHPAVARIHCTGAATVDAQLVELALQFHLLAQSIDPTITDVWFGYDETGAARSFNAVFFQRAKEAANATAA